MRAEGTSIKTQNRFLNIYLQNYLAKAQIRSLTVGKGAASCPRLVQAFTIALIPMMVFCGLVLPAMLLTSASCTLLISAAELPP